jgi:hypothetical protein
MLEIPIYASEKNDLDTRVCARMLTHISWMLKCVAKTIGCGTSDKYTNIHNFYSVKYYKKFIKQFL